MEESGEQRTDEKGKMVSQGIRSSSVWLDPRICEEAGAEKAGKLSGIILGKISEATEGLMMWVGDR